MPERSIDETRPDVTRRVVLRGAAVSSLALPLLAACGDDAETADPPSSSASENTESTPAEEPSPDEEPSALAGTADVEVGGGAVLKDEKVVLTQPTEGDFKAFTAVCTHQQCLVTTVTDGEIQCPCHGSAYSIEDGSVVGGPAPAPLAVVKITVKGDQIIRA